MAIYGTIDAATFGNNVAVTNGDATVTKNAADSVNVGDILVLNSVNYLVREVTSTTSIELHKVYAGSTNATLAGAVRRTAPKAVAEYVVKGGDTVDYELVFVDTTERAIASNKSRGITGPGWWQYQTYQTHNGDTRHKAEYLAPARATAAAAGDFTDDTIVADVLETITIGTQPSNSTSSSGAGTIAVAATVDQSGTITYKWQRQTAAATTRWVDVVGGANGLDTGITYADFTTNTLAYSGLASDALDGYKFRCVINTSKGAKTVRSNSATITFGT
mgnify:FL=1